MKTARILLIAGFFVLALGGDLFGTSWGPPRKYDEAVLKREFDALIESLDVLAISRDYPKAVRKLLSGDPEKQTQAVKTLAETVEVEAIPWLLPFLESDDVMVRTWAAASLQKLVSAYVLKRRDRSRLEVVAIRPLGCGDKDLRGLAWIVLKMFRQSGDGDQFGYAARMARYLELYEFEEEIKQGLKSRHPAAARTAKMSLEGLTLQKEYMKGKSKKSLAIAELGRGSGKELFYLANDHGFLINWLDNEEPELYLYDKPANRIVMTRDFDEFLVGLGNFPRGAKVDRIRGCAITAAGMSEEDKARLDDVIESKELKLTGIDDGNYPMCTCETTHVRRFTRSRGK